MDMDDIIRKTLNKFYQNWLIGFGEHNQNYMDTTDRYVREHLEVLLPDEKERQGYLDYYEGLKQEQTKDDVQSQ